MTRRATTIALLTAHANGDAKTVNAILSETNTETLALDLLRLLRMVVLHACHQHGCEWDLDQLVRYWGLKAAERASVTEGGP